MKFANVNGRATIVMGDRIADVEDVSDGRFRAEPMEVYEEWPLFVDFARTVTRTTGPLVESDLGNPAPAPRQVFAIGINYRSHAEETGAALPEVPITFTKFPACLAGPFDDLPVVGESTDWEVELVVVLGRLADRVDEASAWAHVAGVTVGQDVSDRALQYAAGAQFSLGKSRRGYGPMGPWLVTPDELADPDDLPLGCMVSGEKMQEARTSELIFSVPRLIEALSGVLPLFPGDVIFTGTPSGVGFTRQPQRLLRAGDLVESWIEGIGTIRNRCV